MTMEQLRGVVLLCCLGACIRICGASSCSHAQCRYDYVTAKADCTSLGLDCIPVNYPDALIMDLSHNNISELAPGDLDGTFSRLEELYLDFNNISNVTSLLGSIKLGRLQKLSIKHNIISDLPSVCQLDSLTNLSVDYNMIAEIQRVPKCNTLKSFSADHNLIVTVGVLAFDHSSLNMISLQFNQLTHFYKWVYVSRAEHFQSLILDHNKINFLQLYSTTNHSIDLISVKNNQLRTVYLNIYFTELYLNSNGLNYIVGRLLYVAHFVDGRYVDFQYTDILTKLDISNNSFGSLIQQVWGEGLEVLNADTNQLTNLSPATLSGFLNLKEFHVANNQLLFISPTALANLSKLQSLYLDGNALSSLFGGVFFNQSNLVELSITNNLLAMLHPDYFFGLVSLERLYLAGNQLTSVNSQMFRLIPQILTIDLSRNQLQLVDLEDCALYLTNLQNLSLAHNALQDTVSVLGYCDSLQLLDLSFNLIQVVPALSGRNEALSKLELEGNPLQCDCRLTGLRDWLSTNPPNLEPRCEGPVHEGSLITDLDIQDMTCEPPEAMVDRSDVTTVAGQTASLACTATGIPAPQLTWISPNGTEIPDEWLGRFFILREQILHIIQVEGSDQGIFTCVAKNVLGEVDSAIVNVTVTSSTSQATSLSPFIVFVLPTVFSTLAVTLAVVVLIICLRRCCKKNNKTDNSTNHKTQPTTQPDAMYENQAVGDNEAEEGYVVTRSGTGNPSSLPYEDVVY